MPGKREEYTNWEEYFMGFAILATTRSKDPHNQVGACIVDEEKKEILAIGYNGLPKGMNDDTFDWTSSGELTGDEINIKDNYVIHAEINAILNYQGSLSNLEGKTLYVTWFPCTQCASKIAQVGIKKVIYLREYSKPIQVSISNRIFKDANIQAIPYNLNRKITKDEINEATKGFQKVLKKLSSN